MADWPTNHLDGFEVFVDVDSIEFGVDFREVIATEVGKCDILLAVMGTTWATAVDASGARRLDLADDLVRIEVESALHRGIRVENFRQDILRLIEAVKKLRTGTGVRRGP